MAYTVNDVAKLAGVSTATVSRVINNSTNVSSKTRERVQSAISELNYSPNMLGSNLRKSKSGQILILMPNINNPFYTAIIEGAQDVARNEGYRILVANTYSSVDSIVSYAKLLSQRLIDGLILLSSESYDIIKKLGETYPVVQCSGYNENMLIPYVGINDSEASRTAVSHLVNIGKRKIAMINSDLRYLYAVRRQKAFVSFLEDAGIAVRKDWIKYAKEIDFDKGFSAASELLSGDDIPDAIFCVSDVYAAASIKAAKKAGLSIPKDIAIVGFDNINISIMTDPTITTISQPMYRLGSEACKMLCSMITNPTEPVSNVILSSDLIVRESTIGSST